MLSSGFRVAESNTRARSLSLLEVGNQLFGRTKPASARCSDPSAPGRLASLDDSPSMARPSRQLPREAARIAGSAATGRRVASMPPIPGITRPSPRLRRDRPLRRPPPRCRVAPRAGSAEPFAPRHRNRSKRLVHGSVCEDSSRLRGAGASQFLGIRTSVFLKREIRRLPMVFLECTPNGVDLRRRGVASAPQRAHRVCFSITIDSHCEPL